MITQLSPDEYRLIVEQAPILIWRAGTDGLCDYFNETWLDFTGRTLAQEAGAGWVEGVHPDDRSGCLGVYEDHFERRARFAMEYRLRRHDGVYRWITDHGAPIWSAEGNFLGYIGSCADVTERVEAQLAARQSQEAAIHTLEGLVPVCSYCRRIRNDRDYWEHLESYLAAHSRLRFTHGICPECLPRVQSELDAMRRPR